MHKKYTIAVIGLGLIGGSILKAFSSKDFYLIGVSRSLDTVNKALNLNIVNECSTDINIVKSADIVFICAPISKIIYTIDQISKIVSQDCIVTDVASLKEFVIDHVNGYDSPLNFVGGHPMAGTEQQGIDYAAANLFNGAKWVLTPSKWSKSDSIEKLKDLINLIGGSPIIADANEHDKAAALISHTTLFISQVLFSLVNSYPEKNIKELALRLAASGFRDTTRLAGTNSELAKDMIISNKQNVIKTTYEFKNHLEIMLNNLNSNEIEFTNLIEKLAKNRRKMYSSDGKNIY